MKRKFDHSAPAQRELTGPKYWRSLDELADILGFREHLAREFPEGASSMEGVDRRQFMKIMAASFALGGLGLAGCRRPEAHILPYGKSVEYTVPGLPLYFSTAMPLPEDYFEKLQRELERVTGRKVALDRKLDPTLICGVLVRIGDTVYDGSLIARLKQLKETMQPN